jgi:prophage antirepressor-like protein
MSKQKASKLAVFEGIRIRKVLHESEWWFVVEDVVLALIESRDPELGKGWVQIVRTLPILTEGG